MYSLEKEREKLNLVSVNTSSFFPSIVTRRINVVTEYKVSSGWLHHQETCKLFDTSIFQHLLSRNLQVLQCNPISTFIIKKSAGCAMQPYFTTMFPMHYLRTIVRVYGGKTLATSWFHNVRNDLRNLSSTSVDHAPNPSLRHNFSGVG